MVIVLLKKAKQKYGNEKITLVALCAGTANGLSLSMT